MSETRTCTRCHQAQVLENFCMRKAKTPNGSDYLNSICDVCRKKQIREATKVYRTKPENRAKAANQKLIAKYGITLIEREQLFEAQEGLCAICQKPLTEGQVDVDHDHLTGKVRGLLHNACNQGLGYFQDSIETLQAAIDYLKRNQ